MNEMTKEELLEWGNELLEECRSLQGYSFDLEQKIEKLEKILKENGIE